MDWIESLQPMLLTYGPPFLLALATLVIGWKLVGVALTLLDKALERSGTDKTLQRFLHSLGNTMLKALLLISVASMIGIETTSFIAILGAAGLAIGLALQGSLSNFAGGVLILLFKPFKAGDFIEAQGQAGVVKEIQIFTTMLTTGDNKLLIIPNGPLANGNIINYSALPTRRVDFVFGIGYGDSIDQARATMQTILDADTRILKDPSTLIVVSALADSSVNFTVRAWVNSADYWGVFFDTTEAVKKQFDDAGISIPYPQQDVHLHQVSQ